MAHRPGSHHPHRAAPVDRAEYRVRAEIWRYPGAGGWHFINLSPKQSYEIKMRFAEDRPGWGAVPVTVRIGRTTWETSLFPDRKSETYIVAIKAAVRKQEAIAEGDTVTATVWIR